MSHAGVGLVGLDVAPSTTTTATSAIVHVGVVVLGLVWGVGGVGLVRVRGTRATAGRRA